MATTSSPTATWQDVPEPVLATILLDSCGHDIKKLCQLRTINRYTDLVIKEWIRTQPEIVIDSQDVEANVIGYLRMCGAVRHITLRCSNHSMELAQAIVTLCPAVKSISLETTLLSESFLRVLCTLPLESIRLQGNVNIANVECIYQLCAKHLRKFHYIGCPLTIRQCSKLLERCSMLQRFWCMNMMNEYSEAAYQVIARGLDLRRDTIHQLGLSFQERAGHAFLEDVCRGRWHLTSLGVPDYALTDKHAWELQRAQPLMCELELNIQKLSEESLRDLLKHYTQSKHLTRLALFNGYNISENVFQQLCRDAGSILEDLTVTFATHLGPLATCAHPGATGAPAEVVGPNAWRFIHHLTGLKRIELVQHPSVCDDTVRRLLLKGRLRRSHLQPHPLQTLILDSCNITESQMLNVFDTYMAKGWQLPALRVTGRYIGDDYWQRWERRVEAAHYTTGTKQPSEKTKKATHEIVPKMLDALTQHPMFPSVFGDNDVFGTMLQTGDTRPLRPPICRAMPENVRKRRLVVANELYPLGVTNRYGNDFCQTSPLWLVYHSQNIVIVDPESSGVNSHYRRQTPHVCDSSSRIRAKKRDTELWYEYDDPSSRSNYLDMTSSNRVVLSKGFRSEQLFYECCAADSGDQIDRLYPAVPPAQVPLPAVPHPIPPGFVFNAPQMSDVTIDYVPQTIGPMYHLPTTLITATDDATPAADANSDDAKEKEAEE